MLTSDRWTQLGLWSTSSAEEIPAPSEAAREATALATIPTSPDTSLAWSEGCGPGGFSARMFLHQMMATSSPHWKLSDTERLLSAQTPRRLQLNSASAISLSRVIALPGTASPCCSRSSSMVRGLLMRSLRRGRSLRLLLATGRDTIPVTVTFGSREPECSESWTVTSARPLLASHADGLLAFLRQQLPSSAETPSSRKSRK